MHVCPNCNDFLETIMYPKAEDHFPDEHGVISGCIGFNLGWLDSIIKASALCSLCRLVTRLWDRVSPLGHITYSDGGSSCPLYLTADGPQRIYVYIADSDSVYLNSNGERRNWTIEVSYYIPWTDRAPAVVPTQFPPRLSLLVDDIRFLQERGTDNAEYLCMGRALSSYQPDWKYLRGCLDEYVVRHGDACLGTPSQQDSGLTKTDMPGVRFIDVKHKCLVKSMTIERPYAILSYMWGRSNFLTLSTSNIENLVIPGAFAHMKMPNTIRQAMEATLMLGLQFIWIDSICILQDSSADKHILLPVMGNLYANATVTIVDAASNGADGGLWTHRMEQIVEEVHGLRFIVVEPHPTTILESSQYFTRAWTYQELVLSQRLLIFSRDCAYFSCKSAIYSEDSLHRTGLEGRCEFGYGPEDKHITTPLGMDYLLEFPKSWREMIKEYSRRDLTYQTDALNAALGAIARYVKGDNLATMCGLAVSRLFEYGLLWVPMKCLQRRTLPSKVLPTWSWLGWIGQIMYEDLDQENGIDGSCIVHEWRLTSVNNTTIAWWDRAYGLQLGEYYASDDDSPNACHTLNLVETGILCFRALSAKFDVAEVYYTQLVHSGDQACTFSGVYKVFLAGIWVGGVHLEHRNRKYLETLHDNTNFYYEFIVLSRSSYPPWLLDCRADPDVLSLNDEARPVCDLGLVGEDYEDWEMYNVMLVLHDTIDHTAARIGIGQILQKSFDTASSVVKDIRLL